MTTSTMTRGHAEALRTARGAEATLLSRKPKYELVAIYQSEGGYGGGTWSKQDLLGAILEKRYPLARENEAIHVLHHQPGEIGSTACEWCVCQVTWIEGGFLWQCTGAPGHVGAHGDDDGHAPQAVSA